MEWWRVDLGGGEGEDGGPGGSGDGEGEGGLDCGQVDQHQAGESEEAGNSAHLQHSRQLEGNHTKYIYKKNVTSKLFKLRKSQSKH